MIRADALRRHTWPLTALLVLSAWIFRLHLTGTSVYIGNFDRLNSQLNVLTSWVRAIRDGTSLGWDEEEVQFPRLRRGLATEAALRRRAID